MSKIIPEKKTKLMVLLEYGFSRAVGHTYAEINGVKNQPNGILIIADQSQKSSIDLPANKMVTIQELPQALIGKKYAVVIDHYALQILVSEHNKVMLETKANIERELLDKVKWTDYLGRIGMAIEDSNFFSDKITNFIGERL